MRSRLSLSPRQSHRQWSDDRMSDASVGSQFTPATLTIERDIKQSCGTFFRQKIRCQPQGVSKPCRVWSRWWPGPGICSGRSLGARRRWAARLPGESTSSVGNYTKYFLGCTVKRSKVFGPRHPVQGNWTQGTLHQGNWTQDILDPRKLDPRNVKITEIGPKIFWPNGKWTQDILVQWNFDPRNVKNTETWPKIFGPNGKWTQMKLAPRKFDPRKSDPKYIWLKGNLTQGNLTQRKFDPR